jgi:2-iminoacetate synthase
MKTFTDYWRTLNWDDLRLRINSKTAADVERALNATRLTRDDLMACSLLLPAHIWSLWHKKRSASPASVLATR